MVQLKNLKTSEKLILSFSDFTRIRVMRLFTTTSVELCLCDLTLSLKEPTSKLSRHLKVLREAGILHATKEGRWVFHKLLLNEEYLKHLSSMIIAMPDEGKEFEMDEKHLKRMLQARGYVKCSGTIAVNRKRTFSAKQRKR